MGWVILWRERCDGYGVPGGLPLIVRFFDFTSPSPLGHSARRVESRVRCHWLHFAMENPRPRQLWLGTFGSLLKTFEGWIQSPCAVFPVCFFVVPPFFLGWRDYTVKKHQPFSGWCFFT